MAARGPRTGLPARLRHDGPRGRRRAVPGLVDARGREAQDRVDGPVRAHVRVRLQEADGGGTLLLQLMLLLMLLLLLLPLPLLLSLLQEALALLVLFYARVPRLRPVPAPSLARRAQGIDIRPTIAVTRAHIELPEIASAMEKARGRARVCVHAMGTCPLPRCCCCCCCCCCCRAGPPGGRRPRADGVGPGERAQDGD